MIFYRPGCINIQKKGYLYKIMYLHELYYEFYFGQILASLNKENCEKILLDLATLRTNLFMQDMKVAGLVYMHGLTISYFRILLTFSINGYSKSTEITLRS